MTISTTTLTRAAGLAAVAGGLLFAAVQINHPPLDLALVSTVEWKVRQSVKVVMATLSLAGITGMYLRQVRQAGVLGLLGYLVFAAGYLLMLSSEIIGLCVLPALTGSAPGFVTDILTVANGGAPAGDIGLLKHLNLISGLAYMGGGLLFGIALFRANVLARWAAALLAVGALATAAIPLLPMINQRLFAVPVGIALVGLGYSLWRGQRTAAATPAAPSLAGTR